MKSDPKGNEDQSESTTYLRQVDDTYVFDAASGLYKPKTYEPTNAVNSEPKEENANFPKPLWIEANAGTDYAQLIVDGLSVVVGILTLTLLALTVHYAKKQWGEANRSAAATEIAAIASKDAANTARAALTDVQRAFVNPTLKPSGTNDPFSPTPVSMNLEIIWENGGTTPTRNMRAFDNYSFGNRLPNLYKPYSDPAHPPPKEAPIFLGPKGTCNSVPIRLSFQTLESFWKTNTHIYMWGWARYNAFLHPLKGI
jgi:hypothetical protein